MPAIEALWQILSTAGPLALTGTWFIMWYMERQRANDERKLNADTLKTSIDAANNAADAVRSLREMLFRAPPRE